MTCRPDIFLIGLDETEGLQTVWVVALCHRRGNFGRPWLGIRPTGETAFLRFVEFHEAVMTEGPKLTDKRAIDLQREENGQLAENWACIDWACIDALHHLILRRLDVLTHDDGEAAILAPSQPPSDPAPRSARR